MPEQLPEQSGLLTNRLCADNLPLRGKGFALFVQLVMIGSYVPVVQMMTTCELNHYTGSRTLGFRPTGACVTKKGVTRRVDLNVYSTFCSVCTIIH